MSCSRYKKGLDAKAEPALKVPGAGANGCLPHLQGADAPWSLPAGSDPR